MSNREHCANCYFVEAAETPGAYYGDSPEVRYACRRFPPTPVWDGAGVGAANPGVGADQWCGEWKADA